MDEVGIFINLLQANETDLRLKAFTDNLPNGAVNKVKGVVYGGGDYPTNPKKYIDAAKDLINGNPNAKLFIATCWPSLKALSDALNVLGVSKPVVFAGMVTPTSSGIPSRSTGILAFDIDSLCPNWPALLLQIAPGMTKAAVVYDSGHDGPTSQYDAILGNKGALQITQIPANNADGSPKTDQAIGNDISQFAQTAGTGAGLIVTACTLTGLLREAITHTAKAKGLIAIYPAEMYTRRTASLGLMSYGPDLLASYANAATGYVKPILGGASPDSIPVTTAQDYNLIVNQTLANSLGLTIPPQFTVIITPTIDP